MRNINPILDRLKDKNQKITHVKYKKDLDILNNKIKHRLKIVFRWDKNYTHLFHETSTYSEKQVSAFLAYITKHHLSQLHNCKFIIIDSWKKESLW